MKPRKSSRILEVKLKTLDVFEDFAFLIVFIFSFFPFFSFFLFFFDFLVRFFHVFSFFVCVRVFNCFHFFMSFCSVVLSVWCENLVGLIHSARCSARALQ